MICWEYWQDIKRRREITKDLPKPDLFLKAYDQGYWIEYDTGNECPNKSQYYRAFGQDNTIKNIASCCLDYHYMKTPPPEMVILVEGEDTKFFSTGATSCKDEREKRKIQ